VTPKEGKPALSSDMNFSARRMNCRSSEMSIEGSSKNVILKELSKGASTCAKGTSKYAGEIGGGRCTELQERNPSPRVLSWVREGRHM